MGATIVIVKATDADSGVLGNLSYTISAGNSADFFKVDEKSGEFINKRYIQFMTGMFRISFVFSSNNNGLSLILGEVKLKTSLGSSPPSTFQLAVLATDGLGLSSDIPANVTITVLPNSAQAPVFSQNLYQFSIAENTADDQTVGTVSATVQGLLLQHLL